MSLTVYRKVPFLVYYNPVGPPCTVNNIVCDSLKNPNESEILQNVDKWIHHQQLNHTNYTDEDLSLANVIMDCHRGMTLYKVFRVGEKYDGKLREWTNWTGNIGIDAIEELYVESLDLELLGSDQSLTEYENMMQEKAAAMLRLTEQLRRVEDQLTGKDENLLNSSQIY